MIEGTITAEDYIQAQWLNRFGVLRRFLLVFVCVPVALFLFAAGENRWGFILSFAGVGAAIGELIAYYIYIPWKTRRLYEQHKDLSGHFTYTWDEESISASSESGSSTRNWGNYLKMKENKHMILLYHADNVFEMFPKPWFKNEKQLNEFKLLSHSGCET